MLETEEHAVQQPCRSTFLTQNRDQITWPFSKLQPVRASAASNRYLHQRLVTTTTGNCKVVPHEHWVCVPRVPC